MVVVLALCLFVLMAGFTSSARAADTGQAACRSLRATAADNKIPEQYLGSAIIGRQIQNGLQTIFAGDDQYQAARQTAPRPLSDGYIGGVTRRWLEQLCLDFPVYGVAADVPDAVLRSALHYAEIAAAHPDWKQIVASRQFDDWLHRGSGAEVQVRQVRRSGAAPVVVRLLDEYAAATASETAAAGVGVDACERLVDVADGDTLPRRYAALEPEAKRVQEGLLAVYAGNAVHQGELDPDSLHSEQEIGAQTRKWLQRFCADFPVSGFPAELPENLLRSVLHYQEIAAARPDWREVIIEPAFNNWISQPIPQEEPSSRPLRLSGSAPIVIELIEDYPGEPCPSGEEENAALYYELSERDLEQLKDRAALRGELTELAGKQFESSSELEQAIAPILEALQDDCVRQNFRKSFYDRGRSFKVYRLTKSSLGRLRDQWSARAASEDEADLRLAQDVLTSLGELESEDFESEEQLAQVVRFKAKLVMAGPAGDSPGAQSVPAPKPASRKTEAMTEALVKQVVAAADTVTLYEVPADAERALTQDPLLAAPSEAILQALESLLGVAYVNARLYQSAVREAVAGTDEDAGRYLRTIVTQARKQGEAKNPLDLRAARDCGCARQWDTVGRNRFTVYGFYPFWMSERASAAASPSASDDSAEPADVQPKNNPGSSAVDFGILSRIGYFGLELDEAGRVSNPELWTNREHSPESFVKTAHKYLSQVDVVIEARHWQSWDEGTIEQAVASIARLLIPSAKPSGATFPDGITLYFPDFAGSEPAKQRVIVSLVQKLDTKLQLNEVARQGANLGRQLLGDFGEGNAVSLNILIDAVGLDLDTNIAAQGERRLLGNLKFLGGLSEILVQDEAIVDLVLVLLGQPVTDMKKKLRLAIENEFQGEERTAVLRRILPVIPPNGHEGEAKVETTCFGPNAKDPYWQLQHDLVYFRDNFRGVAFWPFPSATDTDLDVLKQRLTCAFAQSESSDFVQRAGIASVLPNLCVYVCPNRHLFKLIFFGGVGTLLLAGLLAYGSCSVRRWLAKLVLPLLVLVGLLIVIFVAFITCVPTWQEHEPRILGSLVVLLLGSWLFYYIRKVKQGPLP